MTSSPRPELQSAIDRARAGERVALTTCQESDLVLGVRRPERAAELDLAAVRALALKVQHTRDAGGPLADAMYLDERQGRQVSFVVAEPITANPRSVTTFARITVLEPDAAVALVLTAIAIGAADDADDLPVRVELVPVAGLVDDLLALAYRDPVDANEAAETPGTQTSFTGPDRKALLVTSRLEHEWDAKGVLHAWAYDLTAKRTERDWVGRKPMTIKYRKADFYAKHLRRRLHVVGPPIDD